MGKLKENCQRAIGLFGRFYCEAATNLATSTTGRRQRILISIRLDLALVVLLSPPLLMGSSDSDSILLPHSPTSKDLVFFGT